jgi:branched-chain amino acid transport system ATP-binding protein
MSALLNLKNVHAYYGAAHILHGLDLHVNAGERVALVGRNGVGKTTVVNTILGLATLREGHVRTWPRSRALWWCRRGGASWPT